MPRTRCSTHHIGALGSIGARSVRGIAGLAAAALAVTVTTPLLAHAEESNVQATREVRGHAADGAARAGSSPFARRLAGDYVDPDRIYSADVRWWLGDASHTDETLLEEIQKLYDAGFRGVELCMQDDLAAANPTYAYGSEMWTHKWNLVMNKLLDLGMSVYLTSGTNWATSNVPGLDPTSQAAMQNLTLGTGVVEAGQTLAALPAPAASARERGARFVTAYAYKVVDGDTLDLDSYVALSPSVSQGADVWTQNVNWTAPDDGNYRVFAIWTQGTYQTSDPAAEPSYTTNYFDERGVEALKAFWAEHYLSDPALVEKFKRGDVQLFQDSLEIHPGGGSEFEGPISKQPQFTFWAEDMAEEFQARKGYDVTPYLFLIRGTKANVYDPYHSVAKTGIYRIAGQEELRQRVINDFQDVQTQLYRERMLQPLKEWLNSYGIKSRAQISYGKPLENSEPIMDVDYPEAENYNQYNQVDIFRLWTGGSKLENKVLSTETGAQMPSFNGTAQMNLKDAYSAYAAGFQRVIWHVWAADYGFGNYAWPGYDPFSYAQYIPNYFRYLGTRHPDSRDYDELNAHMGRVQQLMQTGRSRTDVGFVHQNWFQGVRFGGGVGSDNAQMNWQQGHQGIYYRSTELQDNGYTYDYFSPRFLFDDDVRFDRRTKTIEQAGYKAIVLYQDWLDVEAAKRILVWAKQGLKVVLLEDAASQTPFNDGKDAVLQKVTDELKTLPTVRQATVYDNIDYFSAAPGGYDDNVMEKLQELGVEPYAGYAEPNLQLLNQTREDTDGNRYVYLYNYADDEYNKYSHKPSVRNLKFGKNIATDVEMDGYFVPYSIDAWTGETTELAEYRWEEGKTVVPVDLDLNNIALMAFEKVDGPRLHVLSTNAESSFVVNDGVVVRVTDTGPVTTALSDGRRLTDQVTVPRPYDITDWNLTVESWRPGDVSGDLRRTETINGVTTLNRKTSTAVTDIQVSLDTLKTWDSIPEVGRGVSGTGHYEAAFDWDADAADGAYLDLGDTLESTMEVWINGHKVGGAVSTNPTKVRRDVGGTVDDGTGRRVPLVGKDLYTGGISWTKPVADVSAYLVDGRNEIVIDYSSVLSNVQLARGAIREELNKGGWWKNDQKYLSFGPQQAKLVPFVGLEYPKSGGPGAGNPTAAPTPALTPTPPTATPPAADKVTARIATKMVKPLAIDSRRRLRVTVRASQVLPTGAATISLKGAGQRKKYTRTLNKWGRTKVWLPRFDRTGRVKVRVVYQGDARVAAERKTFVFKVVQRRADR